MIASKRVYRKEFGAFHWRMLDVALALVLFQDATPKKPAKVCVPRFSGR